jgi:DNA-binding transcriptional MocR family regulator
MITQMLQKGTLQQHISTVLIPAYARRWAKMMEAIEKHLVPLGVSLSKLSLEGQEIFGGYFIWFQLPEHAVAKRIAELAKEREDLVVAHGDIFEVYGDEGAISFPHWMRVCFAWEDEENLEEGIRRLARVIGVLKSVDKRVESGNTVEDQRVPIGEF